MTVRLSTGLRNFTNDSGIGTAFDGGTGRINFYTGTQPATADTAASGTLLATVTLPSDVFAASSSGAVATNAITSVTAAADGTAGYLRFYRTGDTAPGSAGQTADRRLDMSVAASGADVNFDSVTWATGGTVAISGITVTLPAG